MSIPFILVGGAGCIRLHIHVHEITVLNNRTSDLMMMSTYINTSYMLDLNTNKQMMMYKCDRTMHYFVLVII